MSVYRARNATTLDAWWARGVRLRLRNVVFEFHYCFAGTPSRYKLFPRLAKSLPSCKSACRSAKKDLLHHCFDLGSHLLSRDAVGSLKPTACGTEDGPGRGGRQQSRIDTRRHSMTGYVFPEHALDDRDDGALERYLSQLTGATCALGEIVADAECDGAQCSV